MYIGGLDIGTTGCKISLYNERGEFIYKSYCGYKSTRNNEIQEINAEDVWLSVKNVLFEVKKKVPEIKAIGVTSLGESFVMLDKEDNILLPSMLYTDKRGNEEAQLFDSDAVMRIAGVKPHGMYSIPKLMWIKKNLPEIYDKTEKIFLFQDFIVYKLTGKRQIDYSLAARTMGFDIGKKCWNDEIFEIAGINKNKMSEPVCGGTVAGNAGIEGFENTIIISGCHDQLAAVIGAGVFEEGTAVDGTGTVECIVPVFGKIPKSKSFFDDGYPVLPHILDKKYICYALSFTGGAALKWFRDNFCSDKSYKELDSMVSNDPTGILIMPHFAGAANPYMDENSKAVFSGLTLGTTKMDLYRAIMEGVTYEMLLNFERISEENIIIKKLYATGGGASSSVWLQIKSDILGMKITALDTPEVGAVGTVMLAAVSVGLCRDIYEAKEIFVKEGKTYYPDFDKHKKYRELYEKYKLIYNSSKEWRK